MIKNVLAVFIYFFSVASFACTNALPTDNPNFCSSFKTAAACYCALSIPAPMCQDMNVIYNRMIAYFGTLQAACQFQKHTTTQDCIDNWNCYRQGGVDSRGRICSSSRLPCR